MLNTLGEAQRGGPVPFSTLPALAEMISNPPTRPSQTYTSPYVI